MGGQVLLDKYRSIFTCLSTLMGEMLIVGACILRNGLAEGGQPQWTLESVIAVFDRYVRPSHIRESQPSHGQ